MSKIRFYFPKILLTFLLIFLLIGSETALLIQQKALHKDTFYQVITQQELGKKAYSSLDTYFQSRSNSSGIPKEVFMNALDEKMLADAVYVSALSGLDYLNRNSDSYSVTLEFSALETSVTEFFNQYAETNHYEKDEIFNQKVQSTIDEAEKKILFTVDTFKFATLYELGFLEKIRHFLTLFRKLMTMSCIATVLLLFVLVVLCRKQMTESFYWLGLDGLISGLMITVPCLYLLKTDYFSGFVITEPEIFSAIVGYLQHVTNQLCTVGGVTAGIGLLFLVIFAVIPKKSPEIS